MNARKIVMGLMMLTLLSMIASRPTAAQADYQFTFFDGPGAFGTFAYGITNQGLVSGYYLDAAGFQHGFLWKEGTLITVDHPGSLDTLLGQTNQRGVNIGNYDNTLVGSAALYDIRTGAWTTLPDIPGSVYNTGNGISDSGLAVGAGSDDTFNHGIGWVWDGSSYSFFTVPGATGLFGTTANGINNRGQIVGYFQDGSGVFHGFLKEGDTYTTIDGPNAVLTRIFAINNEGDIVGRYLLSDGTIHGLLLHRGVLTTVDAPGASRTYVIAINDRGDLAGDIADSAGIRHAFIATKR